MQMQTFFFLVSERFIPALLNAPPGLFFSKKNTGWTCALTFHLFHAVCWSFAHQIVGAFIRTLRPPSESSTLSKSSKYSALTLKMVRQNYHLCSKTSSSALLRSQS